MQTDALLTAHELASRLRVKAGTVRLWSRQGNIPSIRLTPKTIRYSYAAVCAALAANEKKGGRHDQ
jgi:excisionase family DNA binding protein